MAHASKLMAHGQEKVGASRASIDYLMNDSIFYYRHQVSSIIPCTSVPENSKEFGDNSKEFESATQATHTPKRARGMVADIHSVLFVGYLGNFL